jgi:hypothetical protein
MSPEDIELMKRRIETQLDEYEAAIKAYAAFMEDWRNRTDPAMKRVQRYRMAAQQATE